MADAAAVFDGEKRERWRCQKCGRVWWYTQWLRRTHCKDIKTVGPGTQRRCGGVLKLEAIILASKE